jgi:mannose-6-phosphate isomerase class I
MASQHGPQQALLLGLLWDGSSEQQTSAEIDHAQDEGLVITVDGHREVIEAAQELELRCGEACIVLTADGRIQLRGTYITSHASATQRIVGGSVHVN